MFVLSVGSANRQQSATPAEDPAATAVARGTRAPTAAAAAAAAAAPVAAAALTGKRIEAVIASRVSAIAFDPSAKLIDEMRCALVMG
jgi:hypothetical protein